MSALFPDLVINGETVPAAEIAAEAQNHDGPKGKPGIAWRKAANAIAVRTLLLQEARKRGIEAQAQETGPGRFETEEEALVRGLLDAVVHVETPSDQDIRAEWETDPTRFRAPPLWEISHILIACDPADPEQSKSARTRATVLAGFAAGDPQGFAGFATRESDCASRSVGGALGQIGPGDTEPEFERALRCLTEGQVTSKPIRTRHGWHIIRLDAFAAGAELPFEAVKQKISDAMEKASWARAARDFTQTLVASAEISGADLQPVLPRRAGHEQRHH